MDLTEEQLRQLAFGVMQLAFLGGLCGAIALHLILGAVNAVADRLADRTVRSMRIRAARQRAVKAS